MQTPTLILFATFSRRYGVWQLRIFMRGVAALFGLRFRVYGEIDPHRPLMLIGNHISIFEVIAFPAMFGCGFCVKAEVKKWFPFSWYIARFGNIFIDRRPTKAKTAILQIQRLMETAKDPFAIFPEGTTNNGSYVLPFKSAMFEFTAAEGNKAKIQPVALIYRDKAGNKIPPQVMANEYAYIANAKQTQPPYAERELSIVDLLWGTLMRGGFLFEVHILPAFDPTGLDRKEIAAALHKIVSDKHKEIV